MQVEPRYVTLPELFTNAIYRAPEYQRGYSWTQRQLDDLWSDIEAAVGSTQHFTGMIVVEPSVERQGALDAACPRTMEIIDGQQRLTTLVLLVRALVVVLESLDTPEARQCADRLSELYIGSPGRYRLVLNGDSRMYFEHVLATGEPLPRTENGSQQNILRATRFFKHRLAGLGSVRAGGYERVASIAHRIESNLRFVHVQVDDESEAGKLFETMNNRGKPPSDVDRLKNYMLYLANKIALPREAVRGITALWGDIYKQVMRAAQDGESSPPTESELLRTHWMLYQDAAPTNDRQELSIQQRSAYELRASLDPTCDGPQPHVRLAEEINLYTRHLAESAHAFADLHAPETSRAFDWVDDPALRATICRQIGSFSRMGCIAQPLPLLLAAHLRLRSRPVLFLGLVSVLSSFCFRAYSLRKQGGHEAPLLFRRLARRVHDIGEERLEASIGEIVADLRLLASQHASDTDVTAAISAPDFFGDHHATEIRYLFYELECDKRGGDPPALDWVDFSDETWTRVEHVWPRAGAWIGGTRESHVMIRDRLGNLTVAMSDPEAVDEEFTLKRARYGRSALMVESELARYREWSPVVIAEREAEITEFVLRKWPI